MTCPKTFFSLSPPYHLQPTTFLKIHINYFFPILKTFFFFNKFDLYVGDELRRTVNLKRAENRSGPSVRKKKFFLGSCDCDIKQSSFFFGILNTYFTIADSLVREKVFFKT